MTEQDDLLTQYPGPLTLYPSVLAALFPPVLFFLMFLLVAFLAPSPHHYWLGVIAFGGATLISVIGALQTTSLTLRDDGFETDTLFATRKSLWRNVTNIRTYYIYRAGKKVVWSDAQFGTAFIGYNVVLRGSYEGMKPDDLADLMKAWQARALGHPIYTERVCGSNP
jgi:hypothetical protein